ncbi:Two component transcriptional regulator, LuxR family [Peptoniphilus sp. ING2-D1G]|nr:Two component transcriptional regulator, LuxR family [Peptoniphilus sp. ING2-D1G]
MKIKVLINKDFLKFGITKIVEENHEIYSVKSIQEVKKDEYLITNEHIYRDKTIVVFSNVEEAIFSTANIKILEDSTKFELLEAIKFLKLGRSYSSEKIKKIEEKVLNSYEHLQKLSMRQKFLISEIISGSTNAEISKKLYLSEGTVKNNLSVLYKKINVKNRMELIKICKLMLT